ncbi:modification methylase HemK, partial [Aureobasidium melanogenum]
MPRLSPRILHQARKIDSLLPLVLQGTRDLASAKNELRWLKEHVLSQQQNEQSLDSYSTQQQLKRLCVDRAHGKPLQYIIGTEYFGDLEIACEPGVLIPRRKHGQPPQFLEVVGVDISTQALNLANKNLHRLASAGYLGSNPSLHFLQADILAPDTSSNKKSNNPPSLASALHNYSSTPPYPHSSHWDILISNPPYISPHAFNTTTQRSVKRYEPRLALVPPTQTPPSSSSIDQGDIFYPRLLEIAAEVKAKIVLFEVADLEQAKRVAGMARKQGVWDGVEIWRDWPGEDDDDGAESGDMLAMKEVKTRGTGNGRSVFAYRGDARDWLGLK